jgi:hypothetical protein
MGIEIISLEQMAALTEEAKGCCVYFLWNKSNLLYIGGTKNAHERLIRHERARNFGSFGTSHNFFIPFTRATFLPCDKGHVFDLEEAYLKAYPTPYNDTHIRNRA